MTPHLRPAGLEDAPEMGAILWRFQHQHDWMPEFYTLSDCIAFAETMVSRGWVTVAHAAGRVAGFLARDGEEICALYLERQARGRGVGQALVDHAKAGSARLELRCAEANAVARRFYRRQGFVETGACATSEADDDLPGIALVWPGEAWK